MYHKLIIILRESDNELRELTITANGWAYLQKKYKEKIIKHLQERL